MFVFSYFKEDDEKLYLACSEDGYQWQEWNGGKAIFGSSVGTTQMRDPFIIRGGDGIYHLVWTDGWRSRSIGYARSTDLLNWKGAKLIPVMEHLPQTQNTWAPEVFYDEGAEAYRVIWSSTVGEGPRNHRIWSVTTTDFEKFSEASLFFDPGYNVIDACVADLGESYLMLFKDERGVNEPGTDFKAIRSCLFAKDGSDRPEFHDTSGLLTAPLTEGPTLYAIERDGATEWMMLVDGFQDHYYGAYRSYDLKTWQNVSEEVSLPKGVRHGAVFTR
ncbi:glycoside hydrolase family 43 protein [Paenibacillus periandrae]|uniref:glycoside hydrolase family 43 protein n=1 Tax=Paenibacillus periandrae TaxID=1761741 RepID=UPI001F09883F|nr:glycoside hydrolase family 43 protein [Paenibacillus periandrae]